MTNKQLANQIRKTRGKICVWVNTAHDGFYVAIDKSDYIEYCLMVHPDSEAAMYLKDNTLHAV